jgi:hypothetical protein
VWPILASNWFKVKEWEFGGTSSERPYIILHEDLLYEMIF